MIDVDCLVVGAGVVGLAIARRLARDGREVMIVEAADRFGTETSSRNSEVIHAGLYYPANTLRADLCVSGKRQLYDYCVARGVPVLRCGKLVVATDESERPALEAIAGKARVNGVHDVRLVDAAEARAIEPEVFCVAALASPSSGVVDSHQLMVALLGDARRAGAHLALLSPVIGGAVTADGIRLSIGGRDTAEVTCRTVINSAGLGAWDVARSIEGVPGFEVPARYLAKGTYFSMSGAPPFRGLVYPLPNPASLGVHSCLDLAGQVRFGPDLEWVTKVDYSVDDTRAARLYESIRRWYPGLQDGALSASYSGIRPKVQSPHEPPRDWMILGPDELGVPGLVHLLGMESPGLTACLALADHVAGLLNPLG